MKALEHEYPRWEYDRGEDNYVWPGRPRFVGAKRARELRKRGVPLMPCHAVREVVINQSHRHGDRIVNEPVTSGRGPGKRSSRYCWFETEMGYQTRLAVKWSAKDPWRRSWAVFKGTP